MKVDKWLMKTWEFLINTNIKTFYRKNLNSKKKYQKMENELDIMPERDTERLNLAERRKIKAIVNF